MGISLKDWGVEISDSGIAYIRETSSLNSLDDQTVGRFLLDTDFRELPGEYFSICGLPENANSRQIFQLVKALDISKPVGPEDEDDLETVDEEDSRKSFKGSNRTLKLTLISPGGSLRVEALELFKIPALTDSCIPGTKFLVQGPVRSSAGFLLLDNDSCIRVVGGKVKRLADGFKLNQEVKERRKGMNVQEHVGGPPKFVSFMNLKKSGLSHSKNTSKQPPTAMPAGEPVEPAAARLVEGTAQASDKAKELQSMKLSSNAFAMKSKGSGKGRRERTSRRERDDLVEQYKPPSRDAPQLASFVRLEKISNLQDAQVLHEAMEQAPQQRAAPRGKGKGRSHERPSGKGKGKGGKGDSRRS